MLFLVVGLFMILAAIGGLAFVSLTVFVTDWRENQDE